MHRRICNIVSALFAMYPPVFTSEGTVADVTNPPGWGGTLYSRMPGTLWSRTPGTL